jgi:hypothetical protein
LGNSPPVLSSLPLWRGKGEGRKFFVFLALTNYSENIIKPYSTDRRGRINFSAKNRSKPEDPFPARRKDDRRIGTVDERCIFTVPLRSGSIYNFNAGKLINYFQRRRLWEK